MTPTCTANRIQIRPRVSVFGVKKRIEGALKRNAEIDAQAIRVNVIDGGKVRSEATVHAWS